MSCKGECVGAINGVWHHGPHATSCVDRAPNAQEWEEAERIVMQGKQFSGMWPDEVRARVWDMAWMLMYEAQAEARR